MLRSVPGTVFNHRNDRTSSHLIFITFQFKGAVQPKVKSVYHICVIWSAFIFTHHYKNVMFLKNFQKHLRFEKKKVLELGIL